MKKIIRAFTLIELLVVIAIMTLISSAGIFYFLDFVKDQEISLKLYIIEEEFEHLDRQIKEYKIYDYELCFNTSNTGSKLYINNINIFDSVSQKIDITDSNGNGDITSTGVGTGIIKIYENEKLLINNVIDRTTTYNYDFDESKKYKISGTSSGETLNDIYINYYSEDNIYPENNNNLELFAINTEEDKSGTSITNLKIKNIGGTKKFYNNGVEDSTINKVYLFFENSGKENYIEIE